MNDHVSFYRCDKCGSKNIAGTSCPCKSCIKCGTGSIGGILTCNCDTSTDKCIKCNREFFKSDLVNFKCRQCISKQSAIHTPRPSALHEWETMSLGDGEYKPEVNRLKIEGGFIYVITSGTDKMSVFVPSKF